MYDVRLVLRPWVDNSQSIVKRRTKVLMSFWQYSSTGHVDGKAIRVAELCGAVTGKCSRTASEDDEGNT